MKSFQHSIRDDNAESKTFIETEEEKGTSLEELKDATIKEMQKLLEGSKEFDTLKTAVCRITDCIETKTHDVFINIQDVLRIGALITQNLKPSISEVKDTCSFLSTVLQKDQYLLKNIRRMDDNKRYYTPESAPQRKSAIKLEESLLERNKYLTQIKEDTSINEEKLQDSFIEHEIVEFLKVLITHIKQCIRANQVNYAFTATDFLNLYCRIAILHSYVLWQVFCIKQRYGHDTKGVFDMIKSCHTSSLDMLTCLRNPAVEHAVFLGVFHISENENVEHYLKSLGIWTPDVDKSFYDKIYCIQWKYSPGVKLQMVTKSHCISGIEDKTEYSKFKFEPVGGREMDNICYIRSANSEYKDHYVQMKSDGSCRIVRNRSDQGEKWKLVQIMIHNNSSFLITSLDCPGMFLYLEDPACKAKGVENIDLVKEKGLWKFHEDY